MSEQLEVLFEAGDYEEPHELIIKLKTDDFDWVDPLVKVYTLKGTLYVDNGLGVYEYDLCDIQGFNIREYSPDNIFDWEGE